MRSSRVCIERRLAPGLWYRAQITGEPTPELIDALDALIAEQEGEG